MESNSNDLTRLVDVCFETFEGKVHQFPDMPAKMIEDLLRVIKGRKFSQSSISLVNMQQCCLVLTTRIIKRILIDGEERWVCPV